MDNLSFLPAPATGTVVTVGETMGLVTADPNVPFALARNLALGIGGAESNLAIGLSRLGVTATWVGRIGADPLGELVRREIRAEGVKVHAAVDPAAPTGLMLKGRGSGNNTTVIYYRRGSAGSRLCTADLPLEEIESCKLLHVTGITPALSDSAAEAVAEAMAAARRGSALVSLDVNYRAALWTPEAAGAALRPLVAATDLIFAGEDEAALLVGTQADAASYAQALLELGAREAVIKCGVAGALTATAEGSWSKPAFTVQVLDTVGAGDAFVAGYLTATLAGADIDTRLTLGNATGAFACTAYGDWEAAARPDDVEFLLNPPHDPVTR